MKWAVLLLSFISFLRAEARVFDINSETGAGYFSITGGPSAIKQSAFQNENSTATTYSGKADYNYSGEFGFVYSTASANLRFGLEVLKPATVNEAVASSGGSDLYSLNSSIVGYVPKLGVELVLQKTNNYRSFIQASAGLGNVNLKNDYTILNFSGQSDHSVEAKGTGTLYGASLGVESHFTDTTTYVFEFGYRHLQVNNLKYSKAVTSFRGSYGAGDSVLDVNSEPRTLDFGGGFISLGFRFYL